MSKNCTSYSYSLLLSARNMGTSHTNLFIIPCFWFTIFCIEFLGLLFFLLFFVDFDLKCLVTCDEWCSIGLGGSYDHLLLGNIFWVVNYIVSEVSLKQNRLLTDNAKAASQIMNIEVFNICAIDGDLPWFWFVEAQQQLNDRRFSASRGAYKCYLLPIFNFQRKVFK